MKCGTIDLWYMVRVTVLFDDEQKLFSFQVPGSYYYLSCVYRCVLLVLLHTVPHYCDTRGNSVIVIPT